MAMGWSIRGRYGHSAGAMMPGALLGIFLAISSTRPDWWRRGAVLGLAGAIGWSFGGQTSYGLLVGYTATDSFVDILYGYWAFVLAGAMWGGVGGGILGLGFTLPRSQLNAFVAPLATIGAAWVLMDWTNVPSFVPDPRGTRWAGLYDTQWIETTTAIAVAAIYYLARPRARQACILILMLCAGWLIGLGTLTLVLGLRLNPPRSESWAGCLGLTIALLIYLHRTNNRAALMLARYGLLAGGLGFFLGDVVQIVQRAHWGPFQYAVFQEHGGWGKMEKLFGLIMGLGVALGVRRLARYGLEAPAEDGSVGCTNDFAVFFLFVPMMWWNLDKNIENWRAAKLFPEHFLGLPGLTWIVLGFAALTALLLLALYQRRRMGLAFMPDTALGKGQLLFLVLLCLILGASFAGSLPNMQSASVATSELFYLVCAGAAVFSILFQPTTARQTATVGYSPADCIWASGRGYWLGWLSVPVLVTLFAWACASIAPPTNKPERYRFAKPETTERTAAPALPRNP